MKKNINVFTYAIALLMLSSSFYAHAMIHEMRIYDAEREAVQREVENRPLEAKHQLHVAAEKGYMRVVTKFIESGISIDLKDSRGYTALMYAVKNHQESIVTYLLQSGADANCQNIHGWTALMLAAQQGYTTVISDLIQAGANPNLQSNNRFCPTALWLAAARDYSGCCKIIIAAMLKQTTSELSSLVWCFENLDPKIFIDIQRPLAERQEMFVRQEIEKIYDINLKQKLLDEFFPEKKN